VAAGEQEAVVLWETLRRGDTSSEERSKLVASILRLLKGHLAEVVNRPTGSRVVQACAKHGSAADRALLLDELAPKLLELTKKPYGHFLVCKLINVAPKERLPGLSPLALLKGCARSWRSRFQGNVLSRVCR
jgi:pumilio homology domain family member 6